MRTSDREIPLLPGFCCIMRPGGIYDAGQDELNPLGITYIHFDVTQKGRRGVNAPSMLETWPEFYQADDLDYLEAATRRIVQLSNYAPQPAADLLKAVLSDLLQRSPMSLGGESVHYAHRARIAEMIATIHAESDTLPTVSIMAKKMGLSPAHFSRVFREVTRQSPRDFLLHTRLMRAMHLLAETDLSISEIAERLEYADIFFFSRQFKQKTGMPPSEYRKIAVTV